jgi:phosphoglycolate phosphatase
MMRYRGLIFDLDGTLVDSLRDLAASVNFMRRELGFAPLAEEEVRGHVGDGIRLLMARTAPEADVEQAKKVFGAHYEKHLLDATRPYPGVAETLEELRRAGARLAVITNKPRAFAMPVLEGLGLARHLRMVLGGDSPWGRKPSPEPVRRALEDLECGPEEALIVGDGRNDVQAARAAGVRVCGVLYGLGQPEEIRSLNPDYLIESFGEVLPIARGESG